jgi:hypothetical protein
VELIGGSLFSMNKVIISYGMGGPHVWPLFTSLIMNLAILFSYNLSHINPVRFYLSNCDMSSLCQDSSFAGFSAYKPLFACTPNPLPICLPLFYA